MRSRQIGLRAARSPVALIRPRAPSSAPGTSSRAEQAVALVGAGHARARRSSRPRSRSGRSTARRRPAARRVWPSRCAASVARRIRAAPIPRPRARAVDRERAEQQCRPRRPGGDVPEPDGADDAVRFRSRRTTARRPAGGLRAAARPPWRSARRRRRGRAAPRAPRCRSSVSLRIVVMANSFPRLAPRRIPNVMEGEPAVAGSRRCQMWTVFSGAKPLKATAE